jgi:23S rRNA (adenine2503-C2)-methyltransferase
VKPQKTRDALGLTLPEWEQALTGMDEPAYRARQVYHWLHGRHAMSFAEMTNLPQGLRGKLFERFRLPTAELVDAAKSADGSIKYLFTAPDGSPFEAVRLRSRGRAALCVSTQSGCSFHCRFCATGAMGFGRDLSSSEILHQIYFIAQRHKLASFRVLLMGMGEPLVNLGEVAAAVRQLQHPDGMAFSPRRITVSSIGLRGKIRSLAQALPGVGFALSLHFTDDETRRKHMPATRGFPLAEVLEELALSEGLGKVTLEYALLAGVNDTPEDTAALASIAYGVYPRERKRLPPSRVRQRFHGRTAYHVNLIEYNPVAGAPFAPSREEDALSVQGYLKAAGVNATLRRSRGADVAAACGMLAAGRRTSFGKKQRR